MAKVRFTVRKGYVFRVNDTLSLSHDDGILEYEEAMVNLQKWKIDIVNADNKEVASAVEEGINDKVDNTEEELAEAEAGGADVDLSKEDEKAVAEQEEKAIEETVNTRDMGDTKRKSRVKKKKK